MTEARSEEVARCAHLGVPHRVVLHSSLLRDRLRLPVAAAAAFVPDLQRDSGIALEATLILQGGLEHSAQVGWASRARGGRRLCYISGQGWPAVRSALDLQEARAIDVAREQGDALRLHITTAELNDGDPASQAAADLHMSSSVADSVEEALSVER